MTHLGLVILDRLGFDQGLSLIAGGQKAKFMGLENSKQIMLKIATSDVFPSLRLAKRILEEGGIVYVMADGYRGTGGISVPFHGRRREFRTGFAKLAASTGADVLPGFVSLDTSGHVKLEFFDPLDSGSGKAYPAKQVEWLVQQYASILGKRWVQEPGQVTWGHMKKFLDLPTAEQTI
jgi:lauroyl/myristoyl acyltransferase